MTRQDDLRRARLDRASRASLSSLLSSCPWCWPREGSPERARAEEICPAGPPDLSPGMALLVAVREPTSSLWAYRPVDEEHPACGSAALSPNLQTVLQTVVRALPSALPVLWRAVADAAARPHQACYVDRIAWGPCGPPERVLEGASFGLPFALSLASSLFGRPLPADVAASGAVSESGGVEPVKGLSRKLEVLRACAPGVRRFLVPAGQEGDVAAPEGFTLVPVSSLAGALSEVFRDELPSLLVEQGRDAEGRARMIGEFLRLTDRGRSAVSDWSPVMRSSRLALESWAGLLDPGQAWTLRFVEAVAMRHELNQGSISLPPEGFLESLQRPSRLNVLSHLVQQCNDVGHPDAREIRALADRHAVPLLDAHVEDLRLRGALARLVAISGAPADALRRQREIAEVLEGMQAFEEISYQLSEWYRLAGALGDQDAFDDACRMQDRVRRAGGLSAAGAPYVWFERCRAEIRLWRARGGSETELPTIAVAELTRVAQESAKPEQRAAASRELRRCVLLSPSLAVAPPVPADEPWAQALCDIDSALACADAGAACAAAEVLAVCAPGLFAHLKGACPDLDELPRYVADYWPY